MPSIDDLVNFAIGQQPTKFAAAFDDIMGQKTAAAIDSMRTDVAQGIYATEDEDEDLDDIDADEFDDVDDVEDSEDEFDDIDDLELDDEDFDLDDEDLEGFDDDGEDA